MLQQTNKKVPLPAAIFNRTPNRERKHNNISNSKLFAVVTPTRNTTSPSLRSSSRFQEEKENSKMGNSSIKGDPCMNHQFKEATYYTVGQYGKYCQKCAIFMASQGVKVKKITILSHELDAIARQVDETMRLLVTKKVQTNECQIHCQSTFEEQIAITEQYFMQLHKVIDYYQQQTLNYIENQYNQSQRIQKQLYQIIQQSINECNSIKLRLNPEDQNTICYAQEENFWTMTEVFRMRLNNYKNTVKSWKAEQIVIKPINLCDIGHISDVLNSLYQKEVILYEQPESEMRLQQEQQFIDDDIILQEETVTEDDIQV